MLFVQNTNPFKQWPAVLLLTSTTTTTPNEVNQTVNLKKCFILICFKFYVKVKANQGLQSIKPNICLYVYIIIVSIENTIPV